MRLSCAWHVHCVCRHDDVATMALTAELWTLERAHAAASAEASEASARLSERSDAAAALGRERAALGSDLDEVRASLLEHAPHA